MLPHSQVLKRIGGNPNLDLITEGKREATSELALAKVRHLTIKDLSKKGKPSSGLGVT